MNCPANAEYAALIFLWAPGHFWGVAVAKTKDYEDVQVPMLPLVEGVGRAGFYTALANLLLFPFTMALYHLTLDWTNIAMGAIFGAALIALNLRFLMTNVELM